MSSNPTTAYPPAALSSTSRRDNSDDTEGIRVVNAQPAPASSMTTTRGGESGKGAMRLRGGCIPCPDGGCCYIIPIPCCC